MAVRHAQRVRDPSDTAGRRSWSVLVLLCAAQFMVILDMTVVTVALPSIGRSLGFAVADLQWVATAYLLATGGLTLLGGRAADLFGGRRMFGIGLAVFTAASAASGLAPDATALIASRAAQGAGAALLTPAALGVLTASYAGAQRAAALSVWGALAGGGLATGLLAGGALTTWLGWRSVFLINLPVGLAAFAGARRLLPGAAASRDADRHGPGPRGLDPRGLDLRGAVLAVAGLVGVVYAISEGPRYGWGSARTLVPLALAAVLLTAFWLTERRAASPLLPPGTLRSRSLASGVLVMFAATGLLVGQQLVTSLFLQDVIGASPMRAGMEFLPLVLATVLGAAAASHLAGHAGTRLLAAAGLTLLAASDLLLSRATADGYLAVLLPGMVLGGIGCGLTFPAASMTALSRVRDGMEGLASGLVTTGHEVGAGIGAAVFPALATAAGAAGAAGATVAVQHGASLSVGYQHALTVAAVAAAAIAAIAAAVLPSARPAPGTRVGFH
jgi:EmrB/QacA subfamily drug resistance transporter